MVRLYMKMGLFLLLVFFVSMSSLEAKIITKQSSQCFDKIAGDNDEFLKYRKDFIDLYNLYLSNDIVAIKSFIGKRDRDKDMPKYMAFYFNALAHYYLGFLSGKENEDEALAYMKRAKDLIASSLEYKSQFNESLRLAGDIYGVLIGMQPLMAPFYGSISDSYGLKSHLINADNPLLDISFGRGFYHTPFIFGGDKDRAKEMFEKAYDSCPLLEETSYSILWFDFQEEEIDKKTCDFYVRHKDLANVKVYEKMMAEIKKQCNVLNNE